MKQQAAAADRQCGGATHRRCIRTNTLPGLSTRLPSVERNASITLLQFVPPRCLELPHQQVTMIDVEIREKCSLSDNVVPMMPVRLWISFH
jgi:hypothetical protein